MEPLFTTHIIINGESRNFNVHFEKEAYIFRSDDEGQDSGFSVIRADDTWQVNGQLPEIARQQAVSALEHYLLSQH
jgi:hypothetical protein